ncbi:MAG TPA: Asp-tRNA(Asn)/Glu-tRNA(Gln) amidotransferase subunit GatA [bacterium]|nr:Asp-tRNA(Asn)/Glu-tRNA(Gln) amidotransferase subunit GatA [bacterium]HMZ05860.1 Asp-tRNA(Asn)/Glu-tRNA(Gln) amidotransferase subunit GatA [bacterium]HNF85402.1 Asp-tRNA(Asn)/Glu-tRNA(Gln) amidotransferase subunit GatA [bacterium]HNH29971.1 Asp-tRNA(Asn)/Glu-tRNA(Gln) amidotransferase subunit GatA [bacterium]HNL27028.1 Asp-tRNA(Asn)/Glu-tRNA(Gln) amidotransferase subunit GatA [bacterium]
MHKTFSQISENLKSGATNCETIVSQYLDSIKSQSALNAFIHVLPYEKTIARAKHIDAKVKSGQYGRLAGMVVAVKDAIVVKDESATAGSQILKNYVSPFSATVIERLENEDAIVIGKANMDEFAMGSSNENSSFGPALNPLDTSRVPGGSSGGSAVAVAAGLSTTSLGSETGGSVRLPASFCGVVGLKPTYGRISRYGLIAFASSFDQIGPMGLTVEDTARLTHTIAGIDHRDATSASSPVPNYTDELKKGVKGLRIGIPKEYFGQGLDPEIRAGIEKTIEKLSKEGAVFSDITLPHTEYGIATYYILVTAEASSNLARYDGVRYGHRSTKSVTMADMFIKSRSEAFGEEVKRRIMLGTYVLSAGYYDAYYKKAQKVRTLIKKDFTQVFSQGIDCILAPTSPTVAFKFGEKSNDPLAMYLSDVYTVNINIAGNPAISVPCGKNSENMPYGVQIIGKDFDESMCFRVGAAIESLR